MTSDPPVDPRTLDVRASGLARGPRASHRAADRALRAGSPLPRRVRASCRRGLCRADPGRTRRAHRRSRRHRRPSRASRPSLPAMNVGVVLGSIVRDMHAVPRALDVRTVARQRRAGSHARELRPRRHGDLAPCVHGEHRDPAAAARRGRGPRQRRPRLLRVPPASARHELGGEPPRHERRALHRPRDDELRRSGDPEGSRGARTRCRSRRRRRASA